MKIKKLEKGLMNIMNLVSMILKNKNKIKIQTKMIMKNQNF